MAQLNFSIAMNLLTDQFRNGVSRVKSGFASIRMHVLTFVAALQVADLSVSGFISKLIDTARKTNRAVTALKNISPNLETFSKNQKWLISLSEKYGTDVNTLTGEFAKFTAAGNLMNMPLADQRKIFEAVDRACTGFSLTAEDTNSVFLALTQMMGKGKIQAQELRLQMGEKLPVAINAMAMAAGGSISNLDKLMKEGKLLSADVLPKFADALNKLIPNVNTDNLETSIKRMNNAFVMLVKNTSVQSSYKSLIDWITNLIKSATSNIRTIVNGLIAFIIGSVGGKLWGYLRHQYDLMGRYLNSKIAQSAGYVDSAGARIIGVAGRVGASLRAAFMSMLPTAIIMTISYLIEKIVDAQREAKKIKNIWNDYKSEVSKSGHTSEIEQLKSLNEQYIRSIKNVSQEKEIRKDINDKLGTNYTKEELINGALTKRIGILEKVALAEAYASQKANADTSADEIVSKYGGASNFDELRKKFRNIESKLGKWSVRSMLGNTIIPEIYTDSGYGYSTKELWNDMQKFNQLKRVSYNAKQHISANSVYGNQGQINTSLPGATSKRDKPSPQKQSELDKAIEKYTQSLNELNAQKEIEGMTDTAYNEAKGNLLRQTIIDAKGTNDNALINSEWLKKREEELYDNRYDKSVIELSKIQEEYSNKIEQNKNLYDKGLISEEEYRKNILDLSVESAKSALSVKDIGDKADEFVKNMQNNALSNLVIPSLKDKKADTTFDYRKQKGESNEEELQRVQEYIQLLKDKAKTLGGAISVELDKAIKDATTEELSLILNIVKKDIKDMQKEINRTKWEGIKDAVNGVENIKSSFENLTNTFKENGTAFEKLMALWNTFASVIDTINSVADAIDNVTSLTERLTMAKKLEAATERLNMGDAAKPMADALDITQKLTEAKKVEAAVDTATTATKVSNSATGTAATVGAAAAEAVANKTTVAGNMATAASEVAKNKAKIPIVGIALAVAGVAAMLALWKSLPKFANGGIIGGGSTIGDNTLARVNAGEMILNGRQQSNLFKAINSGKVGGTNVNIGFDKVRGSDIYLSLKNYMKSSGKTL